MKSIWNSLVAGSCNVFGLALLVLSATAGGSAVRAADPSILQNVFNPIEQIVLKVEQRIADLETTVAAFAGSFTVERIVAQELCIADSNGAQTCITKGQLDALLKGAVPVGKTAALEQPAASARESAAPMPEVAVMPSTPSPATEQTAVTADEPGLPLPTVTAAVPSAIDQPATTMGESAVAIPEVATATPSQPATEQGAVATGESDMLLPAVATAMPLPIVPAEVVITTTAEAAKPGTVIAQEQSAKAEEPVHTGSVADPLVPELDMVPAEAPTAPEGRE